MLTGFWWETLAEVNVHGDGTKGKQMVGRSSNCFSIAKDLHLLGIIICYPWMNKPEVLYTLLVPNYSVYNSFIFSKLRENHKDKGG